MSQVACNINVGSLTGALDRTNFLCILGTHKYKYENQLINSFNSSIRHT